MVRDGVASSILAGGSRQDLTSGNAGQLPFRARLAGGHNACPPQSLHQSRRMDTNAPHSLRRSFELHLRAENRAPNTIAGYLESIRQAEAFLAKRGRTLRDADRGDLEAFMAELLTRRSASTAATRYKGLTRPVCLARGGRGGPGPDGAHVSGQRRPPCRLIARAWSARRVPRRQHGGRALPTLRRTDPGRRGPVPVMCGSAGGRQGCGWANADQPPARRVRTDGTVHPGWIAGRSQPALGACCLASSSPPGAHTSELRRGQPQRPRRPQPQPATA
jgi:hypothetical protein